VITSTKGIIIYLFTLFVYNLQFSVGVIVVMLITLLHYLFSTNSIPNFTYIYLTTQITINQIYFSIPNSILINFINQLANLTILIITKLINLFVNKESNYPVSTSRLFNLFILKDCSIYLSSFIRVNFYFLMFLTIHEVKLTIDLFHH
jgi:hypothetical protein